MASQPWNDITTAFGGYPDAGDTASELWGEYVQRNLERLYNPPGVKVQRLTPQTIADANGSLRIDWENPAEWDTDGFHNELGDAEAITVPLGLGGIYRLEVSVTFNGPGAGSWLGGTGTGHAFIEAYVDGNYVGLRQSVALPKTDSIPTMGLNMSGELALPDSSVVKIRPFQNSGSDADLAVDAGPLWATLRWVAPLQ